MPKSTNISLTEASGLRLKELKTKFRINQPIMINRMIENVTDEQIEKWCVADIAAKSAPALILNLASRLADCDPQQVEELMKKMGV